MKGTSPSFIATVIVEISSVVSEESGERKVKVFRFMFCCWFSFVIRGRGFEVV